MLAKKTKAHMMRSFPQKGILSFKAFLSISLCFGSGPDFSSESDIDQQGNSRGERGQVVLEYVLLLAMGLIIGAIVMRNLVGSTDNPKGIRQAWVCLIKTIAQDQPGKPDSSQRPPDCQ